MPQLPLLLFSRSFVKDRDLLKPRVKITAYNQHDVGSFFEPWSTSQPPTYSAIEPTSLCNQAKAVLHDSEALPESKDLYHPEAIVIHNFWYPYSFMTEFSIGVDLGGTNLRVAAVSREGKLLEKVNVPTRTALGPDRTIDEMCSAIERVAATHRRAGKFLGTGIGVLGIIDGATGTVRKSANFPGWEDYPVRAAIENRLRACGLLGENAHVLLDNDANMAALGEQWLGAARGVANVAVITLGTGIGGGIVLNGKIWSGVNGMAGEFGHMTVEPDGVPCGCGNRGCAERYASASAIMRMAREAVAGGNAPSLAEAASGDSEGGAKSIFVLAIQGDEAARRIFQTFGRYLGIMLADAINVLDLEMYVLGGGVSAAWDAFAPSMFEELRKRSLIFAAIADQRENIITRALLGGDAGLYGAARAGNTSLASS
jgi:glucokinase